jgi:hypothetical protein
MGEASGLECLKRLFHVIINNNDLQLRFFRSMMRSDVKKASDMHNDRHGVEGMIGSLDYMHIA